MEQTVKSMKMTYIQGISVESYALVAAEEKAEIVNHMQIEVNEITRMLKLFLCFCFCCCYFYVFAFKLNSDAIL